MKILPITKPTNEDQIELDKLIENSLTGCAGCMSSFTGKFENTVIENKCCDLHHVVKDCDKCWEEEFKKREFEDKQFNEEYGIKDEDNEDN